MTDATRRGWSGHPGPAGRRRPHGLLGTLAGMESIGAGELVTIADDDGGREQNGIVFDTPSHSKVVVAVVDRSRGPVFRTVHPSTLTPRTEESPEDRALRL